MRSATVQIGGADYRLQWDTNAAVAIERAAQRPVIAVFEGVMAGRLEAARLVTWALLQAHHPTVTIEQAGSLLDAVIREGSYTAFGRAMASLGPRVH